jgi:uncharacterized protein
VKIVVDAYNGTVDFYLADERDPIAQAYNRMYPGLLKPMSQMPADLKEHVRYPKGHLCHPGGYLRQVPPI